MTYNYLLNKEDTIAAIATPPGEGGVAIIRISGKNALNASRNLIQNKTCPLESHRAYFVRFIDQQADIIDEGLVLYMQSPRSFTGEDVVELHCHGGALITRTILERVLEEDVRAALPGEFSFRAFLQGKVDLSQAEGIQQVIHAQNEKALDAAKQQLRGSLSKQVKAYQEELTSIAAILEAWVDFPEEGLEFASFDELIQRIQNVSKSIELLLSSYHDGQIIKEGLSLCLLGRSNVGKSSLMNTLLKRERSIVTDIPGTTRDVIEEDLSLNGLNLRLIDTAGVRETEESIEQEGIRRTWSQVEEADLVLLVLDASKGILPEDQKLLEKLPKKKAIVVWNKIDLPSASTKDLEGLLSVKISAKEESNIDELRKQVDQVIWSHGALKKGQVVITTLRHKEALEEAVEACKRVMEGLLNRMSPEFVTSDMKEALFALGRIIGTDVGEDIITAIFTQFCLGK